MEETKKPASFRVPKNYFENKTETLKAIAQKPQQKNKLRQLQPYWAWLAAAAVLVFAVFLWPVGDTAIAPSVTKLSNAEILAFLEEDKYTVHLNSSYTAAYVGVDTLLQEQYLGLSDTDLVDYLSEQPLEFYDLWKI